MATAPTAYLKGYHAGLACLGIAACPFAHDTEDRAAWLRGYHEGYRGYDEGNSE